MAPAVLLAFATEAELRPTATALAAGESALGPLSAWRAETGAGTVHLVRCGVGPAAAAGATAIALCHRRFDLVLSAGLAGGFPAAGGLQVVVADQMLAADLGAESADGFLAGSAFGAVCAFRPPPALAATLAGRIESAGLSAGVGAVITVSTATGTAERASSLAGRYRAAAEAMEGAGVAQAAALVGCPAGEVRAICNPVGPRDRNSWRTAEAVSALARGLVAGLTGPLPVGDGVAA